KLKKNDLTMIFINLDNYDLQKVGKDYNVIVTRQEEEEDYSLEIKDSFIHLDLNRNRCVNGTLILDYNIKTGQFDDAEFKKL
ncbi:MAG: hypothetical protein PHF84_11230, partial [bacterium]|nr:hypothetical protein [bacterium]